MPPTKKRTPEELEKMRQNAVTSIKTTFQKTKEHYQRLNSTHPGAYAKELHALNTGLAANSINTENPEIKYAIDLSSKLYRENKAQAQAAKSNANARNTRKAKSNAYTFAPVPSNRSPAPYNFRAFNRRRRTNGQKNFAPRVGSPLAANAQKKKAQESAY
jgi:hypothetical protein